MSPPELIIISLIRALTEVALLSLLGQGVLAILAGSGRAANPIYQLFQIVVGPVIKAIRFVLPRIIIDKHLPFVTFFLLFWLWIFLAYLKRLVCEMHRLSCFG